MDSLAAVSAARVIVSMQLGHFPRRSMSARLVCSPQ